MARRMKRETKDMRDLRQKIAGMKAIDKSFDAGNGVTLITAEALLLDSDSALEATNQAVAAADDKDNILNAKNKLVRAFNKKILPAGGLKYGTDSSEYELLGGTRESERKKPVRKPKTPTP